MPITTLIMKNNILNVFFETTDFDVDKREYLQKSLSTLCKNEKFDKTCKDYIDGRLSKEQFCDVYPVIAKQTGIHEYTVSLVLLICFTERLKELYKQNGISERIYVETIQDLKYKAQEGAMVKGVCGTFCADWLFKYFELGRFTLGRLQCEVVPLGHNYKSLTPDSPCLKIHIPRSGAPLTPESIDQSIAFAKEFFKEKLPTPTPVICSSYLLYKDFQSVYKEESNLSKFCKRFELVTNTQDLTDDYPNLWRVFDMDYTGNIDDFPEKSSLHKSIKNYLKNGGKTGIALGIFFA